MRYKHPMHRAALALLPIVISSLPACTDATKVSEERAGANAEKLAALAEKDVEEIRKGLPLGGKKLGEQMAGPDANEILPTRARGMLKKTREAVIDLQLAKSTFFAVTDPAGQVFANDQEVDAMAGKNLLAAFPAIAKAKDGYIETMGKMDETRGVKAGEDIAWVAAAPVTSPDGNLKGFYVTGWSMRRFAHHLEEQFKSDMRQEASKSGNASKVPLIYVFVLVGDKPYGAPITPDVSHQAVEALALSSKVTPGTTYRTHIDVTNRTYGLGVRRAPALCDTCSVAVLRSEI
jgi:hypothetical protein